LKVFKSPNWNNNNNNNNNNLQIFKNRKIIIQKLWNSKNL